MATTVAKTKGKSIQVMDVEDEQGSEKVPERNPSLSPSPSLSRNWTRTVTPFEGGEGRSPWIRTRSRLHKEHRRK